MTSLPDSRFCERMTDDISMEMTPSGTQVGYGYSLYTQKYMMELGLN